MTKPLNSGTAWACKIVSVEKKIKQDLRCQKQRRFPDDCRVLTYYQQVQSSTLPCQMSSIQSSFSLFERIHASVTTRVPPCAEQVTISLVFWPTKEPFISLSLFQVLQFAQVLASFGPDTKMRRKFHFPSFICLICLIHWEAGKLVPKQSLSIFHKLPLDVFFWVISQECQFLSVIWQALTYSTAFLKLFRSVLVRSTFLFHYVPK